MARFSQSGGGNPDLDLIKTKHWGYPTSNSVAIIPAQPGETIALKSSGGAQLRWHIRDTGRSTVDYQVNVLSIANVNYANYNGMSYVTFNIDLQDIPLPVGGYYYGVNTTNGNTDFNGSYQASDSTVNSLTLVYPGDITSWDTADYTAYLQVPSVYSQVQADDQGIWIKNDNWTQEPYENVWWQFQRDGGLKFPDNTIQYTALTSTPTFNQVYVNNNDGTGNNIAVGDDAWIGDVNVSNFMSVRGQQDSALGGILFGSAKANKIYTDGSGLVLEANNGDMNLYMDGAAYIGDSISDHRIATMADVNAVGLPVKVRYSPVFDATGLTFTGSGTTYPTYNSYYVKHGDMVTFNIAVDMTTVTNFGTGQFTLQLPFLPIPSAANHFSAWAWVDPSQPADQLNGHIQLVADHLPNSSTLDLHWLKETTAEPKPVIESILSQGSPITFTTASKLYVNGSYIAA